ncbi:calcium-transporting ATPase 9 plasma membrane-type protein [Populus alba x Populus x berolinensis]|nr:calcium-transporting ATPase 9 plasma membrane-type protein [Populus alba x Populus x berolinensis]
MHLFSVKFSMSSMLEKPDQINVFKGVTKNRLFMGIVGFTIILQIILIEFTGDFTTTVRLNWKQWLICVAFGIVAGLLLRLEKLLPVPKTPLSKHFRKPFRRSRNCSECIDVLMKACIEADNLTQGTDASCSQLNVYL